MRKTAPGLTDAERARIAEILVSQNPDIVRAALKDEGGMAKLVELLQRIAVRGAQGAGRSGAVAGAIPGGNVSEAVTLPMLQ